MVPESPTGSKNKKKSKILKKESAAKYNNRNGASAFWHVSSFFGIFYRFTITQGKGGTLIKSLRQSNMRQNIFAFVYIVALVFFCLPGLPPLRGALPPRREGGGGGRDRQTIWKCSERLTWKAWKTKKKGWKVI